MSVDSLPVIIGVGQQTWRDRDKSRTPVDALQAVASMALSDTGSSRVLPAVDALVHIPFLMNQVPPLADAMPVNPGAALGERLGISPAQFSADVGGNLPQQLVNEFAGRLVRGECDVAMICGVELLATFLGAVRGGEALPDWSTGRDDAPIRVSETPVMTADTENLHGLYEPINAYPLFESALAHARGLDMAALQQQLGELVSSMSQVSSQNPRSWKTAAYTAEEVLSTDGGNRLISHPYTKLMNSNPSVDQAACVVMTTVAKAREMGVPEEKWIYLRGAADTHDSWFLSQRQRLHESPALAAAARSALGQAGLAMHELSHFDLYSCFPAALRIACDALGLRENDPRGLTLTGGMFLFGGPGNNYSLHAIAQMAEELRRGPGASGMVTANGGYMTKQSVGVYSSVPGDQPWVPADMLELQRELDAIPRPALAGEGQGSFLVEAHTVRYKAGEPVGGIAIGRLVDQRRCVAVCQDDPALLDRLTSELCVGVEGSVQHRDGLNHFTL